MWKMFKVNNKGSRIDVIDVVLVSWLLTLSRFYTLFWCFHCWLWICKCRLGRAITVNYHYSCRFISLFKFQHHQKKLFGSIRDSAVTWSPERSYPETYIKDRVYQRQEEDLIRYFANITNLQKTLSSFQYIAESYRGFFVLFYFAWFFITLSFLYILLAKFCVKL